MNNKFNTMLACLILMPTAHADNNSVGVGVVEQVDFGKSTLIINSRTYNVKPGIHVNNLAKLKPGSVVNFIMNDEQLIEQLEVRPNLEVNLPPGNN